MGMFNFCLKCFSISIHEPLNSLSTVGKFLIPSDAQFCLEDVDKTICFGKNLDLNSRSNVFWGLCRRRRHRRRRQIPYEKVSQSCQMRIKAGACLIGLLCRQG